MVVKAPLRVMHMLVLAALVKVWARLSLEFSQIQKYQNLLRVLLPPGPVRGVKEIAALRILIKSRIVLTR